MTQKANNPFRPNNANQNPNSNTRYGTSLNSRFGTSNVSCDIVPLAGTLVRFDLNGLGASLCRLLGIKGGGEERESAIQVIENDENLRTALVTKLDAAWQGYGLLGAVLMYPWHEGLQQAIATRMVDAFPGSAPSYLRALDPLLVLNVLARSRSQILLANLPPDLERAFLERSLAADDPRLIELACGTACAEVAFEPSSLEAPTE
jgi:hypothetical protein